MPRPGRPPLVLLYKQGLIPTNPHSHRSQFPLPLLHYRGDDRARSRGWADGGRSRVVPRRRRLQQQLGPGRRRTLERRRTTTTRSSHRSRTCCPMPYCLTPSRRGRKSWTYCRRWRTLTPPTWTLSSPSPCSRRHFSRRCHHRRPSRHQLGSHPQWITSSLPSHAVVPDQASPNKSKLTDSIIISLFSEEKINTSILP
jgi:hypothetical protein